MKKKEQENKAVEKIEQITEKNEEIKPETSDETPVKNSTDDEEFFEQEKERMRAEKEIERIKEKEQKKAERERRILAKKRQTEVKRKAEKRKKEEAEREKLRIKEAKEARREYLKNETAEERNRRLAALKAAKLRQRREEKAKRLNEKRLKAELRAKRLESKRAEKTESKKREKGVGGYVAAVVSLGTATLILATLFTASLTTDMFGKKKNSSEVAQAYYDFVDYVDGMDTNMSKLLVSADDESRQKLLSEITTQAMLAASDVARIPLSDENKFGTAKFVNQVGDYSKYLNNKLIDGLSINKEDWKTMGELAKINAELKESLMKLSSDMGENFDFASISASGQNDIFSNAFADLESRAAQYPELIYDGPFSDGLKAKKAKGLDGKNIGSFEAQKIFEEIFADYGVKNAETVGEKNDKIKTFNIEGEANNAKIYAEISRQGGKIIMFDYYADCNNAVYNIDYCVSAGEKFLQKLGLVDFKPVWAAESGAVAYINYALFKDGVIVYPDMVKVTVCKERGIVSSLDSREYYLNHTEREIGKAKLTAEKAREKTEEKIEVRSVRLALIPKGNDAEVLTYECMGVANGSTYYIYIDAISGKQVKIFKVVETTEGKLLA